MNFSSTLSQFLIKELTDHPEKHDLVAILSDLVTIGKIISAHTNKAGLAGVIGSAEKTNIQGEEVKKMDVFCNELCKDYLRSTGNFAAMASEEEDVVIDMGDFGKDAKYVIAFDPLDGSHNVEVNLPVGTIFSVQRRLPQFDRTDERQFLQAGRDQVLAGYILYSSSTVLVFSWGNGVYEFTLDQGLGEFLLTREKMTIPDKCEVYSFNEAYYKQISAKDRIFLDYLKDEKKCGLRYAAALVADVHRNLITGGVFIHPGVDKKGTGEFKPKLRLNYEVKPMAYLCQQAGGASSNGQKNLLDIAGDSLHERVPVFIGNSNFINYHLNLN
jgi:fructose-1,6-bisphosphatase I